MRMQKEIICQDFMHGQQIVVTEKKIVLKFWMVITT